MISYEKIKTMAQKSHSHPNKTQSVHRCRSTWSGYWVAKSDNE